MKNLILILFVLFISIGALAQDVIHLKNGKELNCKVTEITPDLVKFTTSTSGLPVRTIQTTEIFKIKYENGEVEIFNKNSSVEEKTNPAEHLQNIKSPEPETLPQKDSEEKKSYIGPRIGLNLSKWAGIDELMKDRESEVKSLPGILIGLRAERTFGGNLAFMGEMSFSRKGFKSVYVEDPRLYMDYLQNYLESAALLKYGFGKFSTKIYLNTGLSFAYLLSGKVKAVEYKASSGNISNIQPIEVDLFEIHPGFTRFDACFLIGGGLDILLDKGKIFIDFRLSLGLTKMDDSENPFDISPKNNTYTLSAGYLF